MAAAVNLQRDAGIMLSNLQILSQFATSLHHMSSEIIILGIGQMVLPQVEVADLSPAPRAARAAKYMSAMGLWRPQTGPGDLVSTVFRRITSFRGSVYSSSANQTVSRDGSAPGRECLILLLLSCIPEHLLPYDAMT